MKRQVSPAVAVIVVVLAFACVLGAYWRGLLTRGDAVDGEMGGGGAMPPPPIVGLPAVTVQTFVGPAPRTPEAADAGHRDERFSAARFDGPSSVAITPSGSLYVTDARNHRVRKVAPDGGVTTVAGSGPTSAALGAFADGAVDAARLWNPSGVAVADGGAVWLTDAGNHRVRRLTGSALRTVAGGETPVDRLGLPDGALADGPGTMARFRYPTGIAALPDGALVVVDTGNRRLRKVLPDGTTTTLADLGAAGARSPCGVARLPDGRLLVTDPGVEEIFEVTPAGQVSRLPGINKDAPIWIHPTAIAADATGTVYIGDTGSHCIMRLRPGGAPEIVAGVVGVMSPCAGYQNGTGEESRFAAPCGIVVARPGVLYIADFGNNCIRKMVIPPPDAGAPPEAAAAEQ